MITDLTPAFTLLIAACEQNCYYSHTLSMELQRSYYYDADEIVYCQTTQ